MQLIIFLGENFLAILFSMSLYLGDKRSSTGNLFFTDQFDNHPWEAPPELQPPQKKPGAPGAGGWPPRRRNVSSQDDTRDKDDLDLGDKDPAATLQAMAGTVQLLTIFREFFKNILHQFRIVDIFDKKILFLSASESLLNHVTYFTNYFEIILFSFILNHHHVIP